MKHILFHSSCIRLLLVCVVLLMSTPVRVVAMSDEAKMLRKRQAQLYDTDSTEVFTEVSNRLRVLLEKEDKTHD